MSESGSAIGGSRQTACREDRRFFLTAALVMAVCLLIVFGSPLFSGQSLWGPDNPPVGPVVQRAQLPGGFMGRWSSDVVGAPSSPFPLLPARALLLVLPPLVYHVASYMANVLLLAAAGFLLLRGQGIRRFAAGTGALFLAFSFQSFTIIAAGHLGKFDMMPMAVFMLASLDRGVRRQSLFYYALAGTCAALGFSAQPDVMAVFGMLGGVWGLYRLIFCRPASRRVRYCVLNAAGVVLAGVFFLAVGNVALRGFFGQTLESREAVRGTTPEQQWEFATNWSLPPEEALEFVAPCVFGIETGDVRAPYWGRLGRTRGWMDHRQGLRNLRQHTVYLGVLPLVFAALAVAGVLRRRASGCAETAGGSTSPPADQPAAICASRFADGLSRADTLFWAVVFVVSLLLAFGRYFPLYRLFYMLPYASGMRAPVKFMHLMEVSLAVLFAAGLQLFMTGGGSAGKSKRNALETDGGVGRVLPYVMWGAVAAALLLFAGACAAGGMSERLTEHWNALGLGQFSGRLQGRMVRALVHGACLFAAAAVLFAVRARVRSAGVAKWLAVSVLVLVAADLVAVNRTYVKVYDTQPFFSQNAVTETLGRDERPFRVSCPFQGQLFQKWKTDMFPRFGVDVVDPVGGAPAPEVETYLNVLRANPVRLWQLTNTRYVIGPREGLDSLLRHAVFEEAVALDVDRLGSIYPARPGEGGFVLARFLGALPRAAVYHGWRSLPDDRVLQRLLDADWDAARSVLVSGEAGERESDRAPTLVRRIVHTPQKVRIEAELAQEGILLLNDRHHPDWTARVNGASVEILRCNGVMRGVRLGPGRNEVVFTYRPYARAFRMQLAALSALAVWGALRGMSGLRWAWRASPNYS